jgi:hypothetical protein
VERTVNIKKYQVIDTITVAANLLSSVGPSGEILDYFAVIDAYKFGEYHWKHERNVTYRPGMLWLMKEVTVSDETLVRKGSEIASVMQSSTESRFAGGVASFYFMFLVVAFTTFWAEKLPLRMKWVRRNIVLIWILPLLVSAFAVLVSDWFVAVGAGVMVLIAGLVRVERMEGNSDGFSEVFLYLFVSVMSIAGWVAVGSWMFLAVSVAIILVVALAARLRKNAPELVEAS